MELLLETEFLTIRITKKNKSHPIIKSYLPFVLEDTQGKYIDYERSKDIYVLTIFHNIYNWSLYNQFDDSVLYTSDIINTLILALDTEQCMQTNIDDIIASVSSVDFSLIIPVDNYDIDYTIKTDRNTKDKFFTEGLVLKYHHVLCFETPNKVPINIRFWDDSQLVLTLPSAFILQGLDKIFNTLTTQSTVDVEHDTLKLIHLATTSIKPTSDQRVSLYDLEKYYSPYCEIHLVNPTFHLILNKQLTKIDLTYNQFRT